MKGGQLCKGQTCPGELQQETMAIGEHWTPGSGIQRKMKNAEGVIEAGEQSERETGRQGTDLSGLQICKCHSYEVFLLA